MSTDKNILMNGGKSGRAMLRLLATAMMLLVCVTAVTAQDITEEWVKRNYTKREVMVPMRDGVRLFTSIYEPVNAAKPTPIIMSRTCYQAGPYGEGYSRSLWGKLANYARERYVIVFQDVRGKWMSEGEFVDVRPFIENKTSNKDIDEASDTYDTAEWLVNNVRTNGNIGVLGTSYPGFYTVMAGLSGHPAVKAVAPQAPVTDWWMGDDYHHHGVFMLTDMMNFLGQFFGRPRPVPTTRLSPMKPYYNDDEYSFYLRQKTLKNIGEIMGDSIRFWQDMKQHPNYDDWWKARDSRRHLHDVKPAVLVVGGLFDAEDCYGTFGVYKAIQKQSPETKLQFIMGPWFHGAWERDKGNHLGDIYFGANTSEYYLNDVEYSFFQYYLNGEGAEPDNANPVTMYVTGADKWTHYDVWPPKDAKEMSLYLNADGTLSETAPVASRSFAEYTSDPNHPVPYTDKINKSRQREYMTGDQRFASRRPDVLTFRSPVLTKDVTLAGEVTADLDVAISTTDADFVVKIIDEYPEDFKYSKEIEQKFNDGKPLTTIMGSYQMLVRAETMRGRYRNSFEEPEAFRPGQITKVRFDLPDISHCFKAGHRIVIQVQSSWFPLNDLNPQQFINMYEAEEKDFVKSDIKVYTQKNHASRIIVHQVETGD